jgi:hypothetical protein
VRPTGSATRFCARGWDVRKGPVVRRPKNPGQM